MALVDPHHPGTYPVCPSQALLGLACPLCGGLRATHDLAHGDVAGAAARNPLLVAAVPVLLVAWWRWWRRAGRGLPGLPPVPRAAAVALVLLVVAFGVLRNVPALAPLLGP